MFLVYVEDGGEVDTACIAICLSALYAIFLPIAIALLFTKELTDFEEVNFGFEDLALDLPDNVDVFLVGASTFITNELDTGKVRVFDLVDIKPDCNLI